MIKEKKMYDVEGFLLTFNPNVEYDENDMSLEDGEAVKRFIEKYCETKKCVESTLQQCREVLAMEPFPWEEVADLCEIGVWDEEKQDYVGDNPVLYKQWLEKVTNMLEAEAKKRGLL